jgi:sec-independent protein translocase protein TatB
MREAEMADLKKSFDEVKEAASGFTSGNLMTALEKNVGNALDIDKPAQSAATPAIEPPSSSIEAEAATPVVEAEAHAAVNEPLAITREVQPEQPAQDTAPAEAIKDAKAS